MDSYCPLLTGRREVFKTTAKCSSTKVEKSLAPEHTHWQNSDGDKHGD